VGEVVNRIRVGLFISAIIGLLYSAFGVFESTGKFAAGLIVCSLAVIGVGLVDHLESAINIRLLRQREAVWARRENR
jgi:hypothetical protein